MQKLFPLGSLRLARSRTMASQAIGAGSNPAGSTMSGVFNRIFSLVSVFSFTFIFLSVLSHAASLDQMCSDYVSECNNNKSNLINNISQLEKDLKDARVERDYYKSAYENSSIGEITISDFRDNIDNLNRKIDYVNNTVVNNTNVTNSVFYLSIVFTLELSIITSKFVYQWYIGRGKRKKDDEY